MSSARLAARKVAHRPNRPRFPAPTVLLSALVPAFLVVAPAPAASQPSEVQMEWGVAIPVRDGVNLHGTIYRPANQQEPLPVILGFTPYISDVYHGKARYYASRGYVFAAVDVRGRGNSEGTFEPFKDADRDGHDVVEWLAAQPWSNGKVAMYGASYGGWDQWATAKELPPGLSSIVPAAAAYLGTDFPFVHNVFVPYNMTWLTFTSGNAAQSTIFGDAEMWTAAFTQRYVDHRPFAELDEIVGNPTTHFQTWLEHPTPDDYWKSTAPTPAQLAAMDIPILTITGHYDGDQRGALQHYRMHMQHGNEAAKARHYLVIGPWNHGGVGTSVSSVGGLEFGPTRFSPRIRYARRGTTGRSRTVRAPGSSRSGSPSTSQAGTPGSMPTRWMKSPTTNSSTTSTPRTGVPTTSSTRERSHRRPRTTLRPTRTCTIPSTRDRGSSRATNPATIWRISSGVRRP